MAHMKYRNNVRRNLKDLITQAVVVSPKSLVNNDL